MNHLKKHFSLLLLIVVAFSCSHSNNTDAIRILFIGNSYTYFNSSPELLKALIQEKHPEKVVETKLISDGGMTLAHHWKDNRALEAIQSGKWDYVVLQEQSKLGMAVMVDKDIFFGQTNKFFEYARKFDAEVKKAGSKTVFMMTWSVKNRPNEQAILSHAYASIAKELDAIVAPVGLVWDNVRSNPNINLYANDGNHPSTAGSYLIASTLYGTLLGENPTGLSGTLTGHRLSNSGEPSSNQEQLVDLNTEDAQLIQNASWKVVNAMQKADDYLNFEKPDPTYTIPVLAKGEKIELANITGRWFGTSTYGSDYLGQIMKIENMDGKPKVSLSFYSPHAQDCMNITDAVIEENELILTQYDSLRNLNSTIRISLNKGEMNGILESTGVLKMYKHLNFSKEPVQNEIDLSAVNVLMQSFESNTLKESYVKAAIKHYEQYSQLIGENYKPQEFYLNAEGYNLLREDKVNDALGIFELAMIYYPQSVNTYDSYAEALIMVGRKNEALAIYEKAYELAKKTGYKNINYIEANLNKLRNNMAVDIDRELPPPPPQ
jgi:tetratricopeptide (TPR) repeat protein